MQLSTESRPGWGAAPGHSLSKVSDVRRVTFEAQDAHDEIAVAGLWACPEVRGSLSIHSCVSVLVSSSRTSETVKREVSKTSSYAMTCAPCAEVPIVRR